MVKNYYAILGVLPTATLEEIRSAYRSRVKQYHPDRFGKDSAPFRSVQEAYDVLSDPVHRDSYDRSLRVSKPRVRSEVGAEPLVVRSRKPAAEPLKSTPRLRDLVTISPGTSFRSYRPSIDEIFDDLWDTLDPHSAPKAERFRTLTMEVLLTPDQARRGGRVHLLMPILQPCPTCHGRGEVSIFQCWRCAGTGTAESELPLEVEYPPGIRDFYQVAVPLDRHGVPGVCPILLFRISAEGDFDDF